MVETALDFMTGHRMARGIADPATRDGLRFEASDLDWSAGEGPTVRGPGEAMLLAMAGRPVLDELSGDGVSTLRERLTAH